MPASAAQAAHAAEDQKLEGSLWAMAGDFVFDTDKTCTLLSANQGGAKAPGVTSGMPKR